MFINLPKQGTNPRGVEISKKAIDLLLQDQKTKMVEITWIKPLITYSPYKRWLEYWNEE